MHRLFAGECVYVCVCVCVRAAFLCARVCVFISTYTTIWVCLISMVERQGCAEMVCEWACVCVCVLYVMCVHAREAPVDTHIHTCIQRVFPYCRYYVERKGHKIWGMLEFAHTYTYICFYIPVLTYIHACIYTAESFRTAGPTLIAKNTKYEVRCVHARETQSCSLLSTDS